MIRFLFFKLNNFLSQLFFDSNGTRTNFATKSSHNADAVPLAQHESHRGSLERAVHASTAHQGLRAAAAAANGPMLPQLAAVLLVRPAEEAEAEMAEEAFGRARTSDQLGGAGCGGIL